MHMKCKHIFRQVEALLEPICSKNPHKCSELLTYRNLFYVVVAQSLFGQEEVSGNEAALETAEALRKKQVAEFQADEQDGLKRFSGESMGMATSC